MTDSQPNASTSIPNGSSHPNRRRLLLALGPIVALAIVAIIYFSGGRYIAVTDSNTAADTVLISPQISGPVVSRSVVEGQMVKKGDLLFTIDPVPYVIARDIATAQLAAARDQIGELIAEYNVKASAVVSAQASFELAKVTLARAEDLFQKDAGTAASRDQAAANLAVENAAVGQAKSEEAAALSQLGGDASAPIDDHPSVQQAQLTLRNAQRNLNHTEVRAPFDGKLSNVDSLQVGQQLAVGTPTMGMIGVTKPWIVANIKETDLDGDLVGRPVSVTIDAFPGLTWNGKVTVVGAATGATFAILPAQNTSGNWVKVVQRVPLRIEIDPNPAVTEIGTGLSATATIDTGRRRDFSSLLSDLGITSRSSK